MLRQIYKYDLKRSVDLPVEGRVLKIGVQRGEIMLWWDFPVLSVPETETVEFMVVGTGTLYEVPKSAVFIDTVFSGSLVWHVFQIQKG